MNRLQEKYEKEVAKTLVEEFKLKNKFETPKITKIVINTGVGDAIKSKELFEQIKNDLAKITGQVAQIRPAKKSVAAFSIRKGQTVGLRVTLRGVRMYSFLDKLFSIVLPRLRDFRGLSKKSFDGQGNYTIGIVEHTVFPEIDLIKSTPKGLAITIVSSSSVTEMNMRMLELLGMPFEKD